MYLSILQQRAEVDSLHVSSSDIARQLGLEPIQVRKDLAAVGVTGLPRLGFPVKELTHAIERFLGWDNATDAFVIGAGHLGTALAGYDGFRQHGLNVVALFDNDDRKIGRTVHGKEILPIGKFADLAERLHVHIAVLTVPDESAIEVANLAIDAGIKAIWNFTATKLAAPEGVIVERMDLAASLAVLSSRLAAMRGANHD